MCRWVEYFKEVFGNETERREEQGQEEEQEQDGVFEDNMTPSKEEIMEIIEKLRNNKAPGENGVAPELVKEGGERLHEEVYHIIKEVWAKEIMPSKWNDAIIYPLHKKGDTTRCDNYRGITLLDQVYKIMASAIKNRLSEVVNKEVGEYQCGFREHKSTTDQVFALKQIMNNSIEQRLPLHMCFIDFKQAYDSVIRAKMYEALEELGVPKKLIRLVRMTLKQTNYKVTSNACVSEKFSVNKGLRQGDPISTTLFNLTLEKVIRDTQLKTKGTIFNQRVQVLAYADDIVIITRAKRTLIQAIQSLEREAKKMGLIINETKTKYMLLGKRREDALQDTLRVTTEDGNSYSFEKVKCFNYLGVTVTEEGDERTEIQERLAKGTKCAAMLRKILTVKEVSRNIKVRIYQTIIRPVVLYGCELWTLNGRERESLGVWERKQLRKIYGGIKEGEEWRRRTNVELLEMYGQPQITKIARAQRIRWLGHVHRMEETSITKQVLTRGISGRRGRGRPRTQWLQSVEKDLEEVGVKEWRRLTANRKEWKKISDKAMSQLGSQC